MMLRYGVGGFVASIRELGLLLLCINLASNLKFANGQLVSSVFGSNMVLQRDQRPVIWGFTEEPGTYVTTSLITPEGKTLQHTVQSDIGGLWRQLLPSFPASLDPLTIAVESSGADETVVLENILFGDVYFCSGQSNMQFGIGSTVNALEDILKADEYPHIRIFVGKSQPAAEPLKDIRPELPWSVSSSQTIGRPGKSRFRPFSAVCWHFGRTVADGLDNAVPLGLIESALTGTYIEQWCSPSVFDRCDMIPSHKPTGIYNSMIHPFTIGPMKLSGFLWYQGETNGLNGEMKPVDAAFQYGCLLLAMIQEWRAEFDNAEAFFGIVQLSTWCTKMLNRNGIIETYGGPELLRETQEKIAEQYGKGNNIVMVTAADYGFGCEIHSPFKKPIGERLGRAALATQYYQGDIVWESPSYLAASASIDGNVVTVTVELKNLDANGELEIIRPYNYLDYSEDGMFDCDNQLDPDTCAWAGIEVSVDGWLPAAVTIVEGNKMVLSAIAKTDLRIQEVVGTSYGWGQVPMLSVYVKGIDLPVLPWKRELLVS